MGKYYCMNFEILVKIYLTNKKLMRIIKRYDYTNILVVLACYDNTLKKKEIDEYATKGNIINIRRFKKIRRGT